MFVRSDARRVRLLALATSIAMFGAACGGTSDEVADPTAPTSSEATETVSDSEPPAATATESEPPATEAPETEPEVPATEELRADESLGLEDCGTALCGTVAVPTDHAAPAGDLIDIAVSVHRATGTDDQWQGYLFVNPGGPGGSGIEFAADAAAGGFTPDVLASFDIVGFDPRGVGASEPTFTCGSGAEFRSLSAEIDGDVDTDAEIAAAGEIAGLCSAAMGPVGDRLNSANVAADMDAIRVAFGADQISYYGASYGSALGVWYATLFPDSVRAMVVDGAANPIEEDVPNTLESELEDFLDQGAAFETQFALAIDACVDESCAIYNDGDPAGYIALAADKVDLVRDASLAGSPMAALMGVITPLYAEDRWGELYTALFELVDNDNAFPLAELAREQLGDVAGANITTQVNCLDEWALQPELAAFDADDESFTEELDARLLEELPLIGPFLAEEFEACPFLGDAAPAPLDVPFDGAGVPILVIGNPSDPATPYVQSEELARDVLANGYLVQVDHPSHVVYVGGINQCVNALVESALVEATLPAERFSECEREEAEGPTLDDVPGIVMAVCQEFATANTDVTDETQIATVCESSVDTAIDELGADLILSFAVGENEDRIPELIAVFEAAFA